MKRLTLMLDDATYGRLIKRASDEDRTPQQQIVHEMKQLLTPVPPAPVHVCPPCSKKHLGDDWLRGIGTGVWTDARSNSAVAPLTVGGEGVVAPLTFGMGADSA
jgi:hypothetical protein